MRFLLLLLLSGLLLSTNAQERCGTNEYNHSVETPAVSLKTQQLMVTEEEVIIPVVVHIIYNREEDNLSYETILSQINVLNEDFNRTNADAINTPAAFLPFAASCGIRFQLATIDPKGNATNGIVRKKTHVDFWDQDDKVKFDASGGSNAWNSAHYLNIWVCRLSSKWLGYSSFPGWRSEIDGVVIRSDVFGVNKHRVYNKGRTTTHEVGHWLNLKHIWGDKVCGDDGVDDTPVQEGFTTGCSSFPKIGKCGGPDGEMFMNFMDFSDDACLNMFTNGQRNRMRQLFAPGGARASILNSPGFNKELLPLPQLNSHKELFIYPNPTNGVIRINVTNNAVYKIYNSNGVMVKTGLLTGAPISVIELPAGLYYLSYYSQTSIITSKFLKW